MQHYTFDDQISEEDFKSLCNLSAQIKQIHHQAVLL
ncbi:hypothetical protein CP061683_1463A, partial [Chlamydia psittaci 06-1683]